jgi:hypothetical protein
MRSIKISSTSSEGESQMAIHLSNPHYIIPPGSIKEFLPHPVDRGKAVNLALFNEHRYAFFYWLQWSRELMLGSPPCLISIDWHQDLLYPQDHMMKILANLDQANEMEVALFSWATLSTLNDDHILCAAYLNLIGNVYVVCKQEDLGATWDDEELIDFEGNRHIIKKFKTLEELELQLNLIPDQNVFFDIDLDYFVRYKMIDGNTMPYAAIPKRDVHKILNVERPFFRWLFQRLCGFTIALEPEHCGGIMHSTKLLSYVNSAFFNPGMLSHHCKWRFSGR